MHNQFKQRGIMDAHLRNLEIVQWIEGVHLDRCMRMACQEHQIFGGPTLVGKPVKNGRFHRRGEAQRVDGDQAEFLMPIRQDAYRALASMRS